MGNDKQFKLKLTEMGVLGTGRTYWFCQVYEGDQFFLEYEDNESARKSQVVENVTVKILDKLQQSQWQGGKVEIKYYKPSSDLDPITKKVNEFKVNIDLSLVWSAKPLEYPLTRQEISKWVEILKKQFNYKEKT